VIGHVTSLSVTLSERVLVSLESCALLDFIGITAAVAINPRLHRLISSDLWTSSDSIGV
jgi:hypothetical protein